MTHRFSKWLSVALPVAAVVLAGGLYLLLYGRGEGRAIRSETIEEIGREAVGSADSSETSVSDSSPSDQGLSSVASSPSFCVYVCGQVKCEGVFFLEKGARVADAVEAAGGFAEGAATRFLNLALPVTDGMKIYVPREEEVISVSMITPDASPEDAPVNINTADVARLMTLPGIGEQKAEDIVAFREEHGSFHCTEDIMKVPGIKNALFEKIRDGICVN